MYMLLVLHFWTGWRGGGERVVLGSHDNMNTRTPFKDTTFDLGVRKRARPPKGTAPPPWTCDVTQRFSTRAQETVGQHPQTCQTSMWHRQTSYVKIVKQVIRKQRQKKRKKEKKKVPHVKSTQNFDCFYTGQSPFVLNCQTVFAQVRSKTKQNKENEKKTRKKKHIQIFARINK